MYCTLFSVYLTLILATSVIKSAVYQTPKRVVRRWIY